jgi:hypothetical protein
VQSIHSLLLKSGLRLQAGRKVLIFNDLLLQSIPFMALSVAKEEESAQVLGVVPCVLFYIVCQARFGAIVDLVEENGQRQEHSKSEIRGFFPFGCAQGQNDGR